MADLRSILNNKISSRTPYSSWRHGLVEVQNRNLGTRLRQIIQIAITNWSIQSQMYAFAYKTTPLSQHKRSPYQRVFHTHTRIT